MAKEYTVKTWKAWEDEEGPVRDQHGNYRGSVTFEEYNSEPVDATFKQEPKPGDKKYGDVVEYKTKAGKTRLKFQRADRPQEQASGDGGKSNWQPRDDDAIRAQFAIKTAVEVVPRDGVSDYYERVERAAVKFYAMVDRVKASKATANATQTLGSESVSDAELASLEANSPY